MPRLNEPRRMAIVEWVDSCLQHGQVGPEDYPTPEQIITVGIVVVDHADYITLARDDHKHGAYRGLCCIPKIAVVSIMDISMRTTLAPDGQNGAAMR